MKGSLLLILALVIIHYSCKQSGNGVQAQQTPRDTSITVKTSYSEIFFDSTSMENFISKQSFHDSLKRRIRNFYNARNFQFAWFFNESIAEYASSFYEVYNDYMNYSRDSTLKRDHS